MYLRIFYAESIFGLYFGYFILHFHPLCYYVKREEAASNIVKDCPQPNDDSAVSCMDIKRTIHFFCHTIYNKSHLVKYMTI